VVSIGSIINGGFRLFREQPITVLVWGVINGLMAAGSSMLTAETMRAQLAGQAVGRSPEAFLLWMLPLYLAMMVVGLVITAAAFRAVMRPDARAAAFLRFGGDELRLLVLAIVWFVINFVLYFVMAMLLAVIVAGFMVGSSGSSPGMAMLLGLVIALPILGMMVFIHIRLSPAIPLTVLRRKIVIGDAWRLTKGHFWVLFTGYLLVVLMLAAAYLLVAAVTMGSYWTTMASGGFTPQAIDAANRYRMTQLAAFDPLTILGWLLSAISGAVSYALWAGSVGTATQELLGTNATDYAATFE
jgi:hypothetical protein